MLTKSPTAGIRALLGCGVAVPILYYGLQAIAAPFFPGFAFATTTASEFGAAGAPFAAAFNAGVALMALCTFAASAGVLRALRALGHGWPWAIFVASLVAMNGLQSGWAAVFPMPDPRHGGHPIFIVATLLLTPTCAVLAWRHSASRLVRLAMLSAVVLLVAAVPVLSGALGLDTSSWRGALQRGFTLTVFPPLALLCGLLWTRLRDANEPARQRSALPAHKGASAAALVFLAMLTSHPTVRAAENEPPAADEETGSTALFAALWRQTTPLVVLQQSEHESEQHFLLAVATAVNALTTTLAAEVCGVFEKDDDSMRLVITLMTQGSPAFCLNPKPNVSARPETLQGISIHSHVDESRRTGRHLCGARLAGSRFTEMDYGAGPGYLVHRGRLWHQRGVGTQRLIARLDAASTLDDTRLASFATTNSVKVCT